MSTEDVRARARVALDALRVERATENRPVECADVFSFTQPVALADLAADDHGDDPPTETKAVTRWPVPLRAPAYHGAIGELVRAIDPHTEADPAAVLIQTLVMFGNVIGRTAHFRVEADIHYLNLFTAVVGQTAKGRKG